MFWAYCVQNKTKIETEHSGATYQMSRSEDVGLVCLQFLCLAPEPESRPGMGSAEERGRCFCGRQKCQLHVEQGIIEFISH